MPFSDPCHSHLPIRSSPLFFSAILLYCNLCNLGRRVGNLPTNMLGLSPSTCHRVCRATLLSRYVRAKRHKSTHIDTILPSPPPYIATICSCPPLPAFPPVSALPPCLPCPHPSPIVPRRKEGAVCCPLLSYDDYGKLYSCASIEGFCSGTFPVYSGPEGY